MLRIQIDLEQAKPISAALTRFATAMGGVPEGNAAFVFPDAKDAFEFSMRAAKIGFHFHVHNTDCCNAGEGCCRG